MDQHRLQAQLLKEAACSSSCACRRTAAGRQHVGALQAESLTPHTRALWRCQGWTRAGRDVLMHRASARQLGQTRGQAGVAGWGFAHCHLGSRRHRQGRSGMCQPCRAMPARHASSHRVPVCTPPPQCLVCMGAAQLPLSGFLPVELTLDVQGRDVDVERLDAGRALPGRALHSERDQQLAPAHAVQRHDRAPRWA